VYKNVLWEMFTSGLKSFNTYSQFHQDFTSSFCADILVPKKLQSQTVPTEKLCKALLYEKVEYKMLMKLTPN